MKILYKIADLFLQSSLTVPCLELKNWKQRNFESPSPHLIKQTCLLRNATRNATWVETGTFMGETTELLSKHATYVYSIEPEPVLYKNAEHKFLSHKNIKILNGCSENVFPNLLPNINGDINFWLDGHYSAGVTFQGDKDTPIVDELECIAKNLNHFNKVSVLVDDVRCFNPNNPEFSHYPSIDFLVDWARTHNFSWKIEHDIFIAINY